MRPRYRFNDPKPDACYRGHEYTTENTRVIVNYWGRESRRCRECERGWRRSSYQKHREKRRAQGRQYDARYRAGKKQRATSDANRGQHITLRGE